MSAVILSLSAASSAVGQQANPGFDPRQTEKRFDDRETGLERAARPPLRMPTLATPEAVGDKSPLFVLHAISLVGAHALPPDRLAEAYRPWLGKQVSQADLAAIAQGIGDLYRQAGFHLSRAVIPPQDIADGRVRITVIEGHITQLELKGSGAEEFGARRLLAPVMAESPSRISTLERRLLLVNNWPGVRVLDSSLEEIGGMTGQFRLIVELKTWHVYGWIGVDNLGSSSVGPWQTYASAAFNSYLLPGDSLSVNLSSIANEPSELAFGRISYDAPVGNDGVRVGGSALYSEVRPGDARRIVGDMTTTEAFELRGSFVPIQSQRATLTLTAAMGFSNVSESIIFGKLYDDHVRTLSLTSDYRFVDGIGGTNFATMTFRQGLDILGASGFGDTFVSRFGAAPNFSVLDFSATRYQSLVGPLSAKLSMTSQIASGPLYTSQQLYLGGAAFGRGYGAAEVSGDNGIAGSFELRFDQRANWGYLTGYQLYAFADSGVVWNDGYHPWDGVSLTSAGGGIRLFFGKDLQADLGVAFPLTYRAPDNEWRNARFLLSVSQALRLCPTLGQSCL